MRKLINSKHEKLLTSIQKSNAIAVDVRRSDFGNDILLDISYQKQAMALASKIIKNPLFYVFSDSIDQVKKELGAAENIHYISDATMLPVDDFVLMANASHNITANSTFSWWAAYLNTNPNKLVITPYPFRKDTLLKAVKDEKKRYAWNYLAYAGHAPKDWIALAYDQESLIETARKVLSTEDYQKIFKDYQPLPFKMYSGDLRQLTLCQQGNFKPGVCYLNSQDERPTVVTAYYQIPSKFGHEQYIEWAKNFLTMPFDLVVFTDHENAKWIKEARGNLPMVLVEKTMEEFYHYKYLAEYKEMAKQDINKKHSPELYMIWAEKLKFVKEAISLNPYKAKYYVWCDIGVFRKLQYRDESFPSAMYMWQDHMLFGLINEFSPKDIESGILDPEKDRIQGTMMMGDKQAWRVYNVIWDKMLADLIAKKEPVGKDQHVMNYIALQFPWLIRLTYIDPRYKGNPWWYPLLYYTNSQKALDAPL